MRRELVMCAALFLPASAAMIARADEATPSAASSQGVSLYAPVMKVAADRVVKIYGAKIGREHGFGSGVLVSADGKIVTAESAMLEGERLRVVLADGRRLDATVAARDARRKLALLKADVSNAPYFDLGVASAARPGDWLIAATNCFKIADGNEAVTTAVGVFSARGRLDARRRTQDFPYDGPVIYTDIVVSSPGSEGGALVDMQGRLVGVIGRTVQSSTTNTWANYAMPSEEVAEFLAGVDKPAETPIAKHDADGRAASAPVAEVPEKPDAGGDGSPKPDKGANPAKSRPDVGIQLFAVGGHTKPAYIERVRRDSPAAAAGLRANDLIVSVNGRVIASCEQYDDFVAALKPGDEIELAVKRGEKIITAKLTVGSRP